jgi:sigma-B regulation protein RsbU (phosphoserine phosphatase)
MKLPDLFIPFRTLYARLTLWVMLTVIVVFTIITLIVTYLSSTAVLEGSTENAQSRMEIANQHINSVLVAVEVAVENSVPEVESKLDNPDDMYRVVTRLLELNPNIIGSTVRSSLITILRRGSSSRRTPIVTSTRWSTSSNWVPLTMSITIWTGI